jgi:type II secretory ATPase GspE/PulE/Tfp pilus assembly ATPase PilB-like protein
METVFGSAIGLKSSDVHFEPEEDFTRLRFREDGLLQEISRLDPAVYQRLVNRVKFLSGMKLTNTSIAQDGRFTIIYKGMEVEVRVAVAPGAYNESIVMRILNPEGLAVDFEKLGIEPRLFQILEREIAKPNGMMLTTGPTGSGKTTTLYSFLKKIYAPDIKIITIEDPIEYHLPGITQEQVNHEKGFDFLAGLRAALRQDPDVIMVGEIRDKETATIAVNASLTGHMVFSTLHTNSAAGTIPRLLDLGIQPGILSAALTVSIAQRLVRRLCPDCKKQVTLSGDQESLVRAIIKNGERIGKDFSHYNITSDMPLVAYEPVGCEVCHGSGFKGRVGLYEAILTDDIIAKVMAQEPTPTEREIKKAAEHQKIFTMIEDSVIKILTGATSVAEIQGVIDLTEDVGLPTDSETTSDEPDQSLVNSNNSPSNHPPEVHETIQQASAVIQTIQQLDNPPADELHVLIEYLQSLEHDLRMHQDKHPNIHIEQPLADIRNNIQIMLREVVN